MATRASSIGCKDRWRQRQSSFWTLRRSYQQLHPTPQIKCLHCHLSPLSTTKVCFPLASEPMGVAEGIGLFAFHARPVLVISLPGHGRARAQRSTNGSLGVPSIPTAPRFIQSTPILSLPPGTFSTRSACGRWHQSVWPSSVRTKCRSRLASLSPISSSTVAKYRATRAAIVKRSALAPPLSPRVSFI